MFCYRFGKGAISGVLSVFRAFAAGGFMIYGVFAIGGILFWIFSSVRLNRGLEALEASRHSQT